MSLLWLVVFSGCDNSSEIFTDPRDGNTYKTVKIGDQVWLAENLAYLPSITYADQWGSPTEPQYAVYNYTPPHSTETVEHAKASEYYHNYGVLYNWASALTACPPGWHLPTKDEWSELVDYVVSQGFLNNWDNESGAGNALKSCRQVESPLGENCNTKKHPRRDFNETHYGFDMYGFAGLPGGGRNIKGSFDHIGRHGGWWSATEGSTNLAWYLHFFKFGGGILRTNFNKESGFSIRCIRD